MTETNDTFSAWAIVEVMGRKAYAGLVSESFIAGAGFIRVDIPEVDGKGGTTKLLNPKQSIFNLHITTEDIARAFVAREPVYGIDAFAKLGPTPEPALSLGAGDHRYAVEYDERDDDGSEDGDQPW
jgi:hypothetical protein